MGDKPHLCKSMPWDPLQMINHLNGKQVALFQSRLESQGVRGGRSGGLRVVGAHDYGKLSKTVWLRFWWISPVLASVGLFLVITLLVLL